ncbi:unnamed protein product, partial [Coregonus sp. 'balchen']
MQLNSPSSEYAATMSPVAKAINILQAETNVQMGCLLPNINLLITKLDRIKFTIPLVDALQLGLKKHFRHMFQDPELIAAANLLPKFKTTWTKDDAAITMGMDYIKDHLEEQLQQLGDGTSLSDEEDFSAMKTSQAQEISKQLDVYLACSADHMELLKSFPAVCKLSLRLNTPFHRRERLGFRNVENQILLKMNRKFFNFK